VDDIVGANPYKPASEEGVEKNHLSQIWRRRVGPDYMTSTIKEDWQN